VLWTACSVALWTVAWIVHETVLVPRGWCVGSWSAGLYWTAAKIAVWIGPAIWLLRRAGENPVAATGLGTAQGLSRGLLIALAWLGIQALWSKVRGVWPPPESIGGYGAANAYVIAPVFEEFVFRGFALRRLRARGASFWPAALATSVAFGLLHVPGWLFMKGVSTGTLSLNNVTFSGNGYSSAPQGAIYLWTNTSALVMSNVIMWGDVAGPEIDNVGGAPVTITSSVIQGGCPSGSTCLGVITTDPLLGPLQDNGGPAHTQLPKAGSSAINAGYNPTCAATDQRGVPRPQGVNCDIGAVEVVLDRLFADNFDGRPTP